MEKQYKKLATLHLALCFGVMMIILLLHFFVEPIDLGNLSSKVGPMAMVGLTVASVNVVLSNLFFNKKAKAISTNGALTEANYHEFRGAYIFRWALLEGAILANVMLYFFVEKHAILIVVALLLLLLFYVSKPKVNQ